MNPSATNSAATDSAAARGLVTCATCSLLCRMPEQATDMHCPRCNARLHARKPHSLSRTWAYLLAAYILYIPANLLPNHETHKQNNKQHKTNKNNKNRFWISGAWFIAGLIFFASIVVPLTKLIARTLLLISIHRRASLQPYQRTRLYRMDEFVGRW